MPALQANMITPLTPQDPTEAAMDAITALHTRTIDTAEGFEKMAEKAEPEFRPVAQRFLLLHRDHAARLAAMLSEAGRQADDAGSFMGTINRLVVATRALFDDIDADTMAQVRNGEEGVLEAFHIALSHDHPAERRAELDRMRGELTALVEATRHLA
ncbi:MAG: DUF2383 domain-containing protein [Gemmobacter sp.]